MSANTIIITDNLLHLFEKYCLENGCEIVPIIKIQEKAKDIEEYNVKIPMLLLSYKEMSGEEQLDIIYYKKNPIETGTILALEKCFEDNNMQLAVLKLEFCNMTHQQIELLSNLLVNHNSITEVSVNGNPNEEQNHYLLLRETRIWNLSLKFCSIDSIGLEKISNELSKAFEGCLLHLNLSSNLIGDDGVDYIVGFLRINRTLISLNMADNKIYDEGCLKLVEPFQKFPLRYEEIITSRRIKFDIARKNVCKLKLP